MAVRLFRSTMPRLPLLCLARVVGSCPLPVAHPQPGTPLRRDNAHRVGGAPPCREPPFLGREDAERHGLPDGVLHRRTGNARQRCDVADGEAAEPPARHLGGDRRQDGRLGHGEPRGELRRQPARRRPAPAPLHLGRRPRPRSYTPARLGRLRRDDFARRDLFGEPLRVLLGHRPAGEAFPYGCRQLGKPLSWHAR